MELLPVVCLCLLTRCGITSADGNEPVVVPVKQDGNALLPCSLSTKQNIEQEYFYWYKVAQNNEKQKEVFLYEKGKHSPSFGSQDDGFKGRVSHFPQELKHGNASIIIRNTKMADNGNYTCVFPERQTFHIKLVVGAAPKPNIAILDATKDRALLWCEANGNPQPEVEWRDSAGNKLTAEEPHVSEEDHRFFITLNTTVTKTDRYRCVATQKDISHQIYAETFVPLNGLSIGSIVGIVVSVVLVILAAVVIIICITQKRNKGSRVPQGEQNV
ncbi:butyrophilin subfamily 2 member A2-like [Epinephelus lanceolatus]